MQFFRFHWISLACRLHRRFTFYAYCHLAQFVCVVDFVCQLFEMAHGFLASIIKMSIEMCVSARPKAYATTYPDAIYRDMVDWMPNMLHIINVCIVSCAQIIYLFIFFLLCFDFLVSILSSAQFFTNFERAHACVSKRYALQFEQFENAAESPLLASLLRAPFAELCAIANTRWLSIEGSTSSLEVLCMHLRLWIFTFAFEESLVCWTLSKLHRFSSLSANSHNWFADFACLKNFNSVKRTFEKKNSAVVTGNKIDRVFCDHCFFFNSTEHHNWEIDADNNDNSTHKKWIVFQSNNCKILQIGLKLFFCSSIVLKKGITLKKETIIESF